MPSHRLGRAEAPSGDRFAAGHLIDAGSAPGLATVPNPWAAAVVDRLVTTLDDSSAANPMGVDNMRFVR